MEKLFESSMARLVAALKRPGIQIAVLIAVLAVISGLGWSVYQTQVPPEQPIQFPHKVNVNLGIPCLYCHPGAWRQASAGLPTVQKCCACHDQLKRFDNVPVSQ